jgi:predicted dehydrogenase
MLKGAVFGYGGVGKSMHRQIRDDFKDIAEIIAICDIRKEVLEQSKTAFGVSVHTSLESLLTEKLDFVLITSTSTAHASAAMACANAQIPFLIEKPIALSYKDSKLVCDIVQKSGVTTVVNYSMRFSPLSRKIKEYVSKGKCGDLLSVCVSSYRGYGLYGSGKRHPAITDPATSGGWIIHHLTHIVDFAIWVAGPIKEVHSLTRTTAPEELQSEEVICALLKFNSGAIGTVTDQVGALRDHKIQVVGKLGGLTEVSNESKELLKFSSEDGPYGNYALIDPKTNYTAVNGLDHFLNCLKTGRPSEMPISEALAATQTCEAIKKSAYENRIVQVSEII